MSILRIWHNLHRGLRLLRRIAAIHPRSDVDKVVEDAVIHAEDLVSRLNSLYEKSKTDLLKLEKKISRKFSRSSQELGSIQRSLDGTLEREVSRIYRQYGELGQKIESTNRVVLEQVANSNQKTSELFEQVATLREYISKQQDQVRKLQDGYDWTILKNFSLRVIRCVDNIEKELKDLEESSPKRESLEFIRDELVFALEASGFEQFIPEIDSEYRGQESYVKIVETKLAGKIDEAGKISDVNKAGYFYSTNRDSKILVRSAEVEILTKPDGGIRDEQ